MNDMEVEELVVAVLELDEAAADYDTIEQALYDKFEVTFEQFKAIAELLMDYTIPAETGVRRTLCVGFVKDGAFIVKKELN